MEASTLPKKKSLSKGKMKKTIRNVISRPDPVFWPSLSDEQCKAVETALSKHKVEIPQFKKPQWKDIKDIPKEKRPKPPPIKRVDGLIFGISETSELIKTGQCSAVIVESEVNPQLIVHPLLETCVRFKVSVVCLKNLRKISLDCFGIYTSCLGVKSGYLTDLSEVICDIAKTKVTQQPIKEDTIVKMDVTEEPKAINMHHSCDTEQSPKSIYLYRSDKKSRVFIPDGKVEVNTKKFIGQDFIEFTDKKEQTPQSKAYMKMILKRISNNPNRVKRK